MLRAIFEGRDPWRPAPRLTELLIQHLTLSGVARASTSASSGCSTSSGAA